MLIIIYFPIKKLSLICHYWLDIKCLLEVILRLFFFFCMHAHTHAHTVRCMVVCIIKLENLTAAHCIN